MGRINYLLRLIIRLLFVVLCFVIAFLFTAMENYKTDEIEMSNSSEQPYCEITTKNGATAQSSIEDGLIVLDIVQNGDAYDDIVITLKTAPIKYDTTYLQSIMGDKPQYAEYIEDMKTGPWSANINYRLMGESVLTTGNKDFSLQYRTDIVTKSISSKAATTNDSLEDLIIFEDDEITIDIFMGTTTSGALPTGRYYLYAELDIYGLYGLDNPKLSFIESIPQFIKISIDTLKTVTVEKIFKVSSWLTFYFVMVIFGCLFFAYPDLRAAFRMSTAGKSNLREVTYYVYINGCYSGKVTDYVGTAPFSLLTFILSYLFMLITIPLRIIAQVINSIIHIIRGDDYQDTDPLLANIMGSIGVYGVTVAIVGLISAISTGNYLTFIIEGVLGIVLLVIANILSKRKEEEG